jgi:DNA-binding XRE family transcriptional regulator
MISTAQRTPSGLAILVARRRAGLKQWQLAQSLGISQTTLCDIEHDRRPVTDDMARLILEALGQWL